MLSGLYRRPSGIYAVRIVVPARLRKHINKTEIHASTGCRDSNNARIAALKIQLYWREKLMAIDLERLRSPSPLLMHDGLIPLHQASKHIGLETPTLLNELLKFSSKLFIYLDRLEVWQVESLDAIDRDYDGRYILNDVMVKGIPNTFSGYASLYSSRSSIHSLMSIGTSSESLFLLENGKALFVDGEVEVNLDQVLIQRANAERIRAILASTLPPAATNIATPPTFGHLDPISKQQGNNKFSDLVAMHAQDKANLSLSQRKRIETEANLFISLMGDPFLRDIEKRTILDFHKKLAQLPSDIYLSKRRYKVDTVHELIDIAKQHKLELKKPLTISNHVRKISEILGYGLRNGLLHFNPAHQPSSAKRNGRAQDEREIFTEAEQVAIFTQSWFLKGTGEFNSKGHTNWRPHHYWLPLLGIYTGGRINELSQLYLDDIVKSNEHPDLYYIDFNLVNSDKVNLEGPNVDGVIDEISDKSLKTTNSIRIVPIHDELVRLGLIEYVSKLLEAGHTRLFPELKRDDIKGYGKPAGSWFNERLLGQKLKLVRNGKKSFHSFRHVFINELSHHKVEERITAQIAGHSRGDTESGKRYAKDWGAFKLKPYIDKLNYRWVGSIAPFNCNAGIRAIRVALNVKKRNDSNKLKANKLQAESQPK